MTEIDSSENLSNNISFIDDEDAYKTISKYEIVSINETYKHKNQNKKKASPYLTKFERAKILGQRAKQINNGSPIFVKVTPNIIDGHTIALMELQQKKIPFIIKRPLPNGSNQYWKVSDLNILD